jgi:hypothetical protein
VEKTCLRPEQCCSWEQMFRVTDSAVAILSPGSGVTAVPMTSSINTFFILLVINKLI